MKLMEQERELKVLAEKNEKLMKSAKAAEASSMMKDEEIAKLKKVNEGYEVYVKKLEEKLAE